MNFDTVQLSAVVSEVTKSLSGCRIDKISQPEPLEIVIGFYREGSHYNLLISADPQSARVHLIKQRRKVNPINAPAFCMLLRKYVDGGLVEHIDQPLGFSERVICFQINGPIERVQLWIEVMGRQSNIILTSNSGNILGAVKRVTPAMSRLRVIRPGIPYTPPPRQLGYKRDPMDPVSEMGLPTEPFASREETEKWLTATFSGVGALLAKEVVLRCPPLPLGGEQIWFALNEILNLIRTEEFSPIVYRNETGKVAGAYAFPLRSVPAEDQAPSATMSDALEFAFNAQITDDSLEKERSALLAALRKAHKSSERQLLDIQEGLINADNADTLRESGDLLLANIQAVEDGVSKIEVDDLFAETQGDKRIITLDPTLTVNENAQRYFRKFQKARDSRESLVSRQTALELSFTEIEKAMELAVAAETVEQLSELANRLSGELRTAQYAPPGRSQETSAFDGHKIKTYRSADGWEILVGENSTSNDYLTTKVASPSDIWLHARAVPSAHAVIRAQNRPASVSTAALLLAAEQVAKRSSAKHARLVSVDYTLKKYVRKPRGSAPGQVTYTNEKTLDVIAQSN